MTDHSSKIINGETILWPDASLEKIDAGYEEFTVRIREDAGSTKLVYCLVRQP